MSSPGLRQHGYEGASLSLIGEATGLGKGSLYHFFPGGKEEMARAVIAHIDGWFEDNVFAPLRDRTDALAGIEHMFEATDSYFRSGRRVCLIGAFALDESRDLFAGQIRDYFGRWVTHLADALARGGHVFHLLPCWHVFRVVPAADAASQYLVASPCRKRDRWRPGTFPARRRISNGSPRCRNDRRGRHATWTKT